MITGDANVQIATADQIANISTQLSIQCKEGFYGQRGQSCNICPIGAYCPGGMSDPYSLPGYWRFGNPNVTFKVFTFQPCFPKSACKGNNLCNPGYYGEM